MKFEKSNYSSLDTVTFRTKDYIFETNKNGFYIKQGTNRPQILSVTLDADNYGGVIILSEYLNMHDEVFVYYGDRDFINSHFDDSIFTHSTFTENYTYNGRLGSVWTENVTKFSVWSPRAKNINLQLFDNENDQTPFFISPMERTEKGVFSATIDGNYNGKYYLYEITIDNKIYTSTDPYAIASGTNSCKSMVVNLAKTDPDGFDKNFHILPENQTDAIIYEISVRDFTISNNSGVDEESRGKFLGFVQTKTTSPNGDKTGIDHLKELGITHVHLMPVMDFATVDERIFDHNLYNWGYDPVSYFTPEGSYSSNPSDGMVRIRELKQLIHTLHQNGIGVVLDVIYNHTYATTDSSFNLTMPNYYYRKVGDYFSNGSGCGNELDTQKSMVRNMILESVKYWAQEYAVDGFRFDLMGLMDIETSNMIRQTLDEIDPRIIMYGEGWTGGGTPLPSNIQTNKYNSHILNSRIGLFNDEFRDAIKGDTFRAESPGYVIDARDKNRLSNFVGRITAGIIAQTPHPSVSYNGNMSPFALAPTQTVNYHSAHDNYTLHDKLVSSADWANGEALDEIYKFCAALILTSQGIPFLMGGEEFMRTKQNPDGSFDHNSYKSPDSINEIDWNLKSHHKNIFNYYKGLISLRKSHPIFRINSAEKLVQNLRFIQMEGQNRIGYIISNNDPDESLGSVIVLFNPTVSDCICDLSATENTVFDRPFSVYVDKYNASDKPLYTLDQAIVTVPPVSVMIIGQ